jgi:NADPH:quinone reductase
MKALRFSAFGPPSVLQMEELPIPMPRDGEALVQVKAAAINPSDYKNVAGLFKDTTLPRTPGRDFAGIVIKGGHLEGEEVWGSPPRLGSVRDGSHAQYVVVPVDFLFHKPESLTMEQSAAIGVPFITAWASLVRAARIQPGETILIVGAGGAVGQAATQIANWKKTRVIGAAMSSDALPGADSVINAKTEDLRGRILELTNGAGVDVVFDTVGGAMFELSLRSLRLGGRQVAITSTEDSRVSFNLVDFYHNRSQLTGVDSNALTAQEVAEIAGELNAGFESGVLKPPSIEIVPFEKAVESYEKVAAGKANLKQVLTFS